ncbi:response regulator [Emcibacter nanhaiensis]|uniref:Response regulator n=1 Tax=Emcibacter nanhaiensis TaxID=1505037 RepID=A0A501PHV8_9PROT|nr:response regulator [Emcibacter nanhaiensis]TPD60019.1 response regulator [Emcibacter nanhaiensis]
MCSTFSRTIAVVDDDKDFLEEIPELLGFWGYKAFLFSDPVEAIRFFAHSTCDALITDVEMPLMNGYQVAHEFLERCRSDKIIFISGNFDANFSVEFGGADHYLQLQKPIDLNKLHEKLDDLLSTARE